MSSGAVADLGARGDDEHATTKLRRNRALRMRGVATIRDLGAGSAPASASAAALPPERGDGMVAPMSSETYHEPLELLSEETRNMHRAIVSLNEELEAVDWYQQRAEACSDDELRAVLVHNKNEEIEHAMMNLEWIRRHSEVFDANIEKYIEREGPDLGGREAAGRRRAAVSGAAPAELVEPRHRQPEGGQVMDLLKREHAPITDEAWEQVDDEARRVLKLHLAGRKLVDFSGPHGWKLGGVNTGRLEADREGPDRAACRTRVRAGAAARRAPRALHDEDPGARLRRRAAPTISTSIR